MLLRFFRRLTRQRCACLIELVGDVLHAVVGLRNGGRGKRVGGNNIGAGAEIGEMDIADRIGPAEVEQIVVAAHLAIPGIEARTAVAFLVQLQRLDHGAHGTVEHKNALIQETKKLGSNAPVWHYRATFSRAFWWEFVGLRPNR